MKNQSIARRYAKALLMIGKTDGMADNYKDELNGFASLIAKEMALEQVINNPLYNANERKKVLSALIVKLNLSKVMASFLKLLFDKGRFGFLWQKIQTIIGCRVVRYLLVCPSELF